MGGGGVCGGGLGLVVCGWVWVWCGGVWGRGGGGGGGVVGGRGWCGGGEEVQVSKYDVIPITVYSPPNTPDQGIIHLSCSSPRGAGSTPAAEEQR